MIKQNLNVKNVISIIEDLFPLNLAESWDKVGLQIGEKKKKVENIVVALDLTTDVMDFAIDKKAGDRPWLLRNPSICSTQYASMPWNTRCNPQSM